MGICTEEDFHKAESALDAIKQTLRDLEDKDIELAILIHLVYRQSAEDRAMVMIEVVRKSLSMQASHVLLN